METPFARWDTHRMRGRFIDANRDRIANMREPRPKPRQDRSRIPHRRDVAVRKRRHAPSKRIRATCPALNEEPRPKPGFSNDAH